MQREILFDSIHEFINTLRTNDITKVAFTQINEKRAREVAPGTLQVVDVAIAEILAYKDATIYKYKRDNADLPQLYAILQSQGFELIKRSRNIV
ncbi:MAG TPA: hypothetical protein PL073_13780 [Spirochaetota bacterium]|nr:hypothetical protein [Spirochaetota bacterium]